MKKFLLTTCLLFVAGVAQAADEGAGLAEVSARITYLEEQNRVLNGRISQLEHDLGAASTKLEELATRPIEAAQDKYVVRVPSDNPAQAGDLDGAAAQIGDDLANSISAGELNSAAASVDTAAAEDELFKVALAEIGNQNYAVAKDKFADFNAKYPNSSRKSEVFFWLGEMGGEQGDHKEAALNYLKSYKSDKKGKRAEEALLKASIELGKLDKKQEACRNLKTLMTTDGTQEMLREQAGSEAIKLGCK